MGAEGSVAVVFWRPLGSKSFQSATLTHVARGVYRAELPASELDEISNTMWRSRRNARHFAFRRRFLN